MGTGRNWTRRSIEELVEAYMKKHGGGGSVDPSTVSAKLTLPNSTSYGYLNFSSAPSGYTVGIIPDRNHGMHMFKFNLMNSGGSIYTQLGLGVERYDVMNIQYASDAVFTADFYPYRIGVQRSNTPISVSQSQTMATLRHHLIFLSTSRDGDPILRCPADSYIQWLVASASATVVTGVTVPDLVTVAPNASKMKDLRDAIVDKEADIAQAMGLSGTLPLFSVKAYFISTDSLSLTDNELVCELLASLYPPINFDPASVIDFTL